MDYCVSQYLLNCVNSRQHRWYYFPKMTKDEVILFKMYDSDTSKEGRFCFHTAFTDPGIKRQVDKKKTMTRSLNYLLIFNPKSLHLLLCLWSQLVFALIYKDLTGLGLRPRSCKRSGTLFISLLFWLAGEVSWLAVEVLAPFRKQK